MDLPTIRQLEYALALSTTLSFREAARDCHVTQPSLSAQVQLLEDMLGVRLFEHDRRRVILTDAGNKLMKGARRVIDEARLFVEVARTCKEPLSGSLCMGAIPTVAPYVLPPVFSRIRSAYPDVELHLCEELTPKIVEKLIEGDLDVILVALESMPVGRFATLPLFEDPFRVAVPRNHVLAEREFVREQDLLEESILLLSDGHCLRDQAIALCERIGAHSYDTHRAGSLTTLVRMVASGLGVTILPSVSVDLEANPSALDGVVVLPFQTPAPRRTIGLAWRPNCPRSQDFELLAQEIGSARESASSQSFGHGEQIAS